MPLGIDPQDLAGKFDLLVHLQKLQEILCCPWF